ncbi:hypothetical protein B0H11DRAFT_2246707 [Mycena galericulata]|nr:hypothetical protein B0H11DRAFT_2246707 [Mycena galericulata]
MEGIGWESVLASTIGVAVLAAASAMGAAVRFVNLQITDLVDDPPSPAYLLLLICLLPLLNFFAPAAWKCLERTGIIPPMEDTVQIGSSQVAAAAQRDMLIFPTKTGGTEERTL